MKQLQVFSFDNVTLAGDLTSLAQVLRRTEKQTLDFAPWQAYPYKPAVQFSMAYDAAHIFLQYSVQEKHLQAAEGHNNGPVYQDSCVEFFVSFDDGASYYNFEFNCIGTVLAGYGQSREEREWLPENILRKLRSQSLVKRGGGEVLSEWELTLALPLEVFAFHSLSALKGLTCRANFYKCGDSLPEPHYLAWSNIHHPKPDFHLPRFFGTVKFV